MRKLKTKDVKIMLKAFHLPSSTAAATAATTRRTILATIARIMAPISALVAPVLRMERSTRSAASATSTTAARTAATARRRRRRSGRTATAETAARLSVGQFHACAPTANRPAIETADRVLGVTRILELDERKAWRIASHPHVAQRAVVAERVLDFVLACAAAQLAHVHLAVVRMACHFCDLFGCAVRTQGGEVGRAQMMIN